MPCSPRRCAQHPLTCVARRSSGTTCRITPRSRGRCSRRSGRRTGAPHRLALVHAEPRRRRTQHRCRPSVRSGSPARGGVLRRVARGTRGAAGRPGAPQLSVRGHQRRPADAVAPASRAGRLSRHRDRGQPAARARRRPAVAARAARGRRGARRCVAGNAGVARRGDRQSAVRRAGKCTTFSGSAAAGRLSRSDPAAGR